MERCLLSVFTWIKRQVWSLIVAYMLGLHNFYFGDTKKTPDNASNKIEINEPDEDASPKV